MTPLDTAYAAATASYERHEADCLRREVHPLALRAESELWLARAHLRRLVTRTRFEMGLPPC